MGRHKKQRFIDKKNSQTFHVVHRSQRDPLQADEDSSKQVLAELHNLNDKHKDLKNKEEQVKLGIYFDDDYDYTQHLRKVDAEQVWEVAPSASTGEKRSERKVHFIEEKKSKANLPPEVFQSEYEEEVGLLNKAAPISGPRLDLDPDLVEVMDDDFDFDDPDNQLEDDFVLQAQGEVPIPGERLPSEGEEEYLSSDGAYDSDDPAGSEGYDDHMTFNSEGNKSRFTEYSISSSVMHRNKGLSLLDDRFEKLFEEYDDMEVGALDQDDIQGYVIEQSEVLQQVLSEFEQSQKKQYLPEITDKVARLVGEESDGEEDEKGDDLIKLPYEDVVKEKWDCESILSTYSNLYNHPKVIEEPIKGKKKSTEQSIGPIRLSQKTGLPLDVLPQPGPTRKQLERQEYDETRLPVIVEPRMKGEKETLEQKKERKMAVKNDRRDRRMEKKANKTAFKDEQKKQEKALLNVQQNMQGVKIS